MILEDKPSKEIEPTKHLPTYKRLQQMCHYWLQECTSGVAETPHGMFTESDTETQKILFRPRLDDRSVGAWRKRKERNAQNQQSNAAANAKAK